MLIDLRFFSNTVPEISNTIMFRKSFINGLVVFIALIISFVLIEIYYRVFDPFPYFSEEEINATEYGNLLEYDALLGWRGKPNAGEDFTNPDARTTIRHNQYGFRDIDHAPGEPARPAIVFLGDSFTWGFAVEFDEMFVNLLRKELPRFEVYNFSHRGYGTDQQLLVFKDMTIDGPMKWVILMFSENDPGDNNSNIRSGKNKPQFQFIDGRLTLTGVPVAKQNTWPGPDLFQSRPSSIGSKLRDFVLRSHLMHDLVFRYNYFQGFDKANAFVELSAFDCVPTGAILKELKSEVEKKDAQLLVVFIPSLHEIENPRGCVPYQRQIAKICRRLKIDYLDLAPYFKGRLFRSYYRIGRHWNARGHRIAAYAILKYLTESEKFADIDNNILENKK